MDASRLEYFVSTMKFEELAGTDNLIMTGPCRLAFANLAEPRVTNADDVAAGKAQPNYSYGGVLIIPPAVDLSLPKRLAAQACEAKFGPNWKALELRTPFRPQAKNAGKYDGFGADGVYLDVSSKFAVKVRGMRAGADGRLPFLDLTDGQQVYSGMWVRAVLNTYTYDSKGNRGCKFGLRGLQKIADDDEFTGGDATDSFAAVPAMPGEPSAPAPTAADDWGI